MLWGKSHDHGIHDNDPMENLGRMALHQLLHGGAELLACQPTRPVAVQHLPHLVTLQIRRLGASPYEVLSRVCRDAFPVL